MARYTRSSASTTVSSTALKLLPANPGRIAMIFQETGGTNPVRFASDDDNLAATLGILVGSGQSFVLDGDACWTGDVWAVCTAAGDATVTVTEVVG